LDCSDWFCIEGARLSNAEATPPAIEGVIEEKLPQGLYRVRLVNGSKVTASLGGAARQTTVRVIPGDRVLIEVSPIDPTRGRIKARLT
jgi:translation initiation factor IF-1